MATKILPSRLCGRRRRDAVRLEREQRITAHSLRPNQLSGRLSGPPSGGRASSLDVAVTDAAGGAATVVSLTMDPTLVHRRHIATCRFG